MQEDRFDETSIVAPCPLAMVVCDAIWCDPGTGKQVLLGLFSAIHARTFPAVHPVMAIHVALTDARGTIPIRLVLVDANEEREPLFDETQDVEFPDPRAVIELDFHLGNLRFDEPGEYRFQLYGGSTPLMERRIVVSGPLEEDT